MIDFLKNFDRALRFARQIDADRFCYDKRYRRKIETMLRDGFADEPKVATK